MILKPDQKNILKRMYNRILTHKSADKLINDSIFLTLINMQDSKRLRMLTYNHLYKSQITDKQSVKGLVNSNLIKEVSSVNGEALIFTAKGIYNYEKSHDILTDSCFINYYETKFFTFKWKQGQVSNT